MAQHGLPSSLRAPLGFRKTRIVCISDTHNQTPKLPPGDILIHAGDLTNQGSYDELAKTVMWLEKAEFEVKIVVAGNHDITLDAPFYASHGSNWRWPKAQDPALCRKLLTSSPSITYLENEAVTVYLTAPTGPHTCLKVFGSPCTPQQWEWAFQYQAAEAESVWAQVPEGVDVVVTHTPPRGHCDGDPRKGAGEGEVQKGCLGLLTKLAQVRPLLNVCGHVHGGRGAERLKWTNNPSHPTTHDDDNNETHNGSLVAAVSYWTDPGAFSKKLSLLDLTSKSGQPLRYGSADRTRQLLPYSLEERLGGQPDAVQMHQDEGLFQPPTGDGNLILTSSLTNVALPESEALWRRLAGGAIERRAGSDVGHGGSDKAASLGGEGEGLRDETVVINAAFLGPRIAGKSVGVNKPMVVDVELPVWGFEGG